MLEYIILGFLQMQDMTGYDIKQQMTVSTTNFYDASFGSIYPMLKKMEKQQHIRFREEVEGGKFKKVYTITARGREVFYHWLEQPIALDRARHDHLVRIFFYSCLPVDKVKQLINGFIQAMEEELNVLGELEKKITDCADFYQMSTMEYGKYHYAFTIKYYKKFLIELEL